MVSYSINMKWRYYRINYPKHLACLARIDKEAKSAQYFDDIETKRFKAMEFIVAKILCRDRMELTEEEAFLEMV